MCSRSVFFISLAPSCCSFNPKSSSNPFSLFLLSEPHLSCCLYFLFDLHFTSYSLLMRSNTVIYTNFLAEVSHALLESSEGQVLCCWTCSQVNVWVLIKSTVIKGNTNVRRNLIKGSNSMPSLQYFSKSIVILKRFQMYHSPLSELDQYHYSLSHSCCILYICSCFCLLFPKVHPLQSLCPHISQRCWALK